MKGVHQPPLRTNVPCKMLQQPTFFSLNNGSDPFISLASIDPHGRFVAAQCNLCARGQVTLASVYAVPSVAFQQRQERAPFFTLQCLVPALPARTPLVLGGDWNCVAGDQDLVGGQPGTRQHGFHSGLFAAGVCKMLSATCTLFFFFFFLGYRGIAYSPSARSCRRRQTNLIVLDAIAALMHMGTHTCHLRIILSQD